MKNLKVTFIKLNQFQLKLLFYLCIICRPEFIIKYEGINVAVNVCRILITVILVANYIMQGRINKNLLAPVIIFGGYNILCLTNSTWDFNVLIEFALVIDIYIFTDIYIAKHTRDVYMALTAMLFLYGVCNTYTILAGYDNQNLFLGFDNDVAMRVIPLLGLLLYLSVSVHEKIIEIDYLISFLFLLDFLMTWAITGVISLLMMYLMVFSRKFIFKQIKSYVLISLSFFMWICLYIVRIQNLFDFIMVGLLRKDVTLAYRTYIWESVIEAIKRSVLLGYGKLGNSESYYRIVYPMYFASTNPHNLGLYIMASAGIVGLIFFILFIIHSFKNVDKNINFGKNKILLGTLGGYLLCGMFSSYYAIEYLCFILAAATFDYKLIRLFNNSSGAIKS